MLMAQTKKIACVVSWVVAGLCVPVLILAVGVRVDQYLLRRNAERLLTDLKSLEMRKSTYRDARQVIDGCNEEMHQEGPCRPYWCDVRISLGDFLVRHEMLFADHQRLEYVYQLLGGRPARIDGFVRVRKDIVWGKGIIANIVSDSMLDQDGGFYYLSLIGRAQSGSPDVISSLHPEYGVGSPGGCTFCLEGHVVFTPYADPVDVTRLMVIGLSCLTR